MFESVLGLDTSFGIIDENLAEEAEELLIEFGVFWDDGLQWLLANHTYIQNEESREKEDT